MTGIAALGLDHTSVLGKTIAAIAEKKGGIYKNGVPALSVSQPEEGMIVLKERAEASQASYFMEVPILPGIENVTLGLAGEHQLQNAALAVQMANIFLHSMDGSHHRPEPLSHIPASFISGLENTKWPGRCQTVPDPKYQSITWYLDGAHTAESVLCCTRWFVNPRGGLCSPPTSTRIVTNGISDLMAEKFRCTRVLVFNCTKGRSGLELLGTMLEETQKLLLQYKSTERVENLFQQVIFPAVALLMSRNRLDLARHVGRCPYGSQSAT